MSGDVRLTFAVTKVFEPVMARLDALLDGYPDKVDLIEATEVSALRHLLRERIVMIGEGLCGEGLGGDIEGETR